MFVEEDEGSSLKLPDRFFAVEEATVNIGELTAGTWYKFKITSVGIEQKENTRNVANVPLQTC